MTKTSKNRRQFWTTIFSFWMSSGRPSSQNVLGTSCAHWAYATFCHFQEKFIGIHPCKKNFTFQKHVCIKGYCHFKSLAVQLSSLRKSAIASVRIIHHPSGYFFRLSSV